VNALRKALLLGGLGLCASLSASGPTRADELPTKTNDTDSTTSVRSDKRQTHADAKVAPDNTGTNKRDRDPKEITADQQKSDKSDIQVTAEIRRAIMKDKTLSVNAHNIKIIVQQGHVTLKGPVSSNAEKATVERKAAEVMNGSGAITNEVAVAP
jgi:hypothetical protein